MWRSVYTVTRGRVLPNAMVSSTNQLSRQIWHGPEQENDKTKSVLNRVKQELEEDKKRLQWRTSINETPGEWRSKFKLFSNDEQTSDFITMMQKPVDLSPSGLMKSWMNRKERIERHMQQYIPQRHEILGADLAAAHFLLFRGGAVKFVNSTNWVRANKKGEYNLPNKFHPDYKVEALRCDNMKLYYEGLENLRCLQHLKFLSFHDVGTFDDFCLDRVSGSQYPKLEVLDISGTHCTSNGLACLYRVPSLKLLIVDDVKQSLEYELTCAMLEEVIPLLKIVDASTVHGIPESEG